MTAATHGSTPYPLPAPTHLNLRLSILIFLGFAIMGAWVPVFSLHLKKQAFSAEETAWASAANAIGALLAPILWGQIADRWLAMERCISLCALITGVGLWFLADLTEPWAVISVCIAMWFFLIPTIGLTTSYVFRQIEHPERDYGFVRMFGTIGWMVASWCLALWFWLNDVGDERDFADSLRLGGIVAFALALYAWTLPHTPRTVPALGQQERTGLLRLIDAPLSALRLFRDRSYVVYCVCMFGMNITLPFTIQLNPLLLDKLGVSSASTAVCLTISQSTEVLFLFLLPRLLKRFGMKAVMIGGGLSWTLGFALLSVGAPVGLVLPSLLTHGVFVCCFFISGQVFVNKLATHDIRASAQGLLLLISGSGLLLGHLLVGWVRDYTENNYRIAYMSACVLAGCMVLLFLAGFAGTRRAPNYQDALVGDSGIT